MGIKSANDFGFIELLEREFKGNMLLSTMIGLLLSIVAFGTLVAGDPGTIITLSSAKVTNNANDYFDPWTVEITKGKKSSQATVKMPTKKQLPDSMQFKLVVKMGDGDPIEYSSSLCDALTDETVGKSFVRAGVPKDKFPQECPFKEGDWTVLKWDPPTDAVPPGVPDGPITGNVQMFEEGKEPYVTIDFEGEIKHGVPGMGR